MLGPISNYLSDWQWPWVENRHKRCAICQTRQESIRTEVLLVKASLGFVIIAKQTLFECDWRQCFSCQWSWCCFNRGSAGGCNAAQGDWAASGWWNQLRFRVVWWRIEFRLWWMKFDAYGKNHKLNWSSKFQLCSNRIEKNHRSWQKGKKENEFKFWKGKKVEDARLEPGCDDSECYVITNVLTFVECQIKKYNQYGTHQMIEL